MITLDKLFEVHAAFSLDKQMALSDMLGDCRSWRFDPHEGTICFGGKNTFNVQILGTESFSDGTFLWSWANTQSAFRPELLKGAGEVRSFGVKHDIQELTQPELPLKRVDGTRLAMIASGLCKADCFYRGTYDGGAVFLLLNAPLVREFSTSAPQRVARVFTELISGTPLHHRSAFQYYLHYKGYSAQATDAAIVGTSAAGEQVQANFDCKGRLTRIIARVRPLR
ncbi:MAG TPA: hypothetical protein VEK08_10280 [Planctomycetota bacterium]|nr:hypothetical protein [Planctomycetota bacterium]